MQDFKRPTGNAPYKFSIPPSKSKQIAGSSAIDPVLLRMLDNQ
ncbi:hypothetical protein [Phormidesmis priestleyi]|nr:hypothetical protein [Phormidesmis priestleyi]